MLKDGEPALDKHWVVQRVTGVRGLHLTIADRRSHEVFFCSTACQSLCIASISQL